MTFLEPKAEILTTNIGNVIKQLANCARTCYQSFDNASDDNDLKLVKALIKNGHHSVLEHITITMRLTTSRMVTHELVRHRLASYSERSTRYCDSKDLHIVAPIWVQNKIKEVAQSETVYNITSINDAMNDWLHHGLRIDDDALRCYFTSCERVEHEYNNLMQYGCTKENASSVLPNDTATEIVLTANLREWRHIFKMRLAKNARPEMRQIMQLAFDEMLKIKDMDVLLNNIK